MRSYAVLLILAAVPRVLAAQCPEGTPPPCRGANAPARAALPAPDPNRIAILPFRVTGADSTLGEGIAELLSAEFTGESGPRAAHMGSVMSAWRQQGGSIRTPLTQQAAVRAARQLGAGKFVDGSIVGLGNRLTVTASVVSIDGQSRRAEPIRGSSDSLDVLIGRLTTTLLALAGGESREGSRGVLTSSPAAMRAYVEGMAAWRRYHREEANNAFERAFREDSTFARAALMRFWSANFVAEAVGAQWARRVFALRDRLSANDRLLVTALLGEKYPAPRVPAVSFGDRARAAAQLPESPEAQYLAGDWLFHYGAAINAVDWAERSRGYLAASFALDSQQTVLGHLVDVAVLLADSALLRSLEAPLEAHLTDMLNPNLVAAGYLGDRAWLARALAARGSAGVATPEAMAMLPAATIEVILQAAPDQQGINVPRAVFAAVQGRPDAMRRALDADSAAAAQLTRFRMLGALVGATDTVGIAALVRSTEAIPLDGDAAQVRDCHAALWHAWWQDGAPERPLTAGDALQSCVIMVELLRAWRQNAPDLAARLAAADSAVRSRIGFTRYQGYENFILWRIWLSQGNRERALSAIRLYPIGPFPPIGLAERLREEGRLAAELGQVDRAIQAYRMYLEYRKDAEPSMIPQRDSVRAAMQRLVRP